MKHYRTLMSGALLVAALLLGGCDNTASGPPKEDTSQQIQMGNNPAQQPGTAVNGPGGMPPGAPR